MDLETHIISYFKLNENERNASSFIKSSIGSAAAQNIAVGYAHIAILNADGTVTAVGANENFQCDTVEWRDVVKVAAGDYHTVALKSDGTVVATGDNSYGQCDVELWTDITDIFAEKGKTVGIRADGAIFVNQGRIRQTTKKKASDDKNKDKVWLLEDDYSPAKDFSYDILAYGVKIKNYLGNAETVCLPETIKGQPVRSVENNAFKGNNTIKRLVLTKNLTAVYNGAFSDCTALEEVVIREGVELLGAAAFSGCINLKKVFMQSGLSKIGCRAFEGCINLEEITIPGSVTALEGKVFNNCVKLKKVKIHHQSVLEGKNFDGCDNLSVIEFENNAKHSEGLAGVDECNEEEYDKSKDGEEQKTEESRIADSVMRENITLIKQEALKWNDDLRKIYLNNFLEHHRRLMRDDKSSEEEVVIMIAISNKMKYISLNSDALEIVCRYLKNLLEK